MPTTLQFLVRRDERYDDLAHIPELETCVVERGGCREFVARLRGTLECVGYFETKPGARCTKRRRQVAGIRGNSGEAIRCERGTNGLVCIERTPE